MGYEDMWRGNCWCSPSLLVEAQQQPAYCHVTRRVVVVALAVASQNKRDPTSLELYTNNSKLTTVRL